MPTHDDPTNRTDAIEPLFAYRQTMHDFRLRPETSALLIVDLQNGSAAHDGGYARVYRGLGYDDVEEGYLRRVGEVVVPNVRRLQTAFRGVGAPVIFLTVGTIVGDYSDMPPRFARGAEHWRRLGLEPPYARAGTRNMAVLDEIAPLPAEPVIMKTGASGFTASALPALLFNHGIRELAICGVATAYCVESTLRDAADHGYDTILVEDASADSTDEIHQRGVAGCAAFGRVDSTDHVVAELLGADAS